MPPSELCPDDDVRTPSDLELRAKTQIANHFFEKYREAGDLKDLGVAVRLFQGIVDQTPAEHPSRAGQLGNLAVSVTAQYRRSGNLQDLEAALQRNQEMVDLTPANHPERAQMLQSLALSFTDRYRRLGNLEDLGAALQTDQEAIDLTPVDHPGRARRLQSLAVSLRDRYQRLGALDDLEATLQKMQEAVDLTPVDHPDKAGRLEGLAASLGDRYQRLGALDDLEATLQKMQEAVYLTPVDHPDRAGRLRNLAVSVRDRYQRLGALDDLEATLQKMQEAVDLTPVDHPHKAGRLQSLALSFRHRYQRLGSLDDLEATLQKMQEAVDLTPVDHPDRAGRLQSLAASLRDRYRRLGSLDDLEASLQKMQEAVDLTPVDHPERAGRLQSLAVSLGDRYHTFQRPQDLDLISQHYCASFNTPAPSAPEPSWTAALSWASFSQEFCPMYCCTAYSAAFNLLPELLWMGHSIPIRQDAILRLNIAHTASTATRICIGMSDLVSGIQFIEQGLATTFQQVLQLRPDFHSIPPNQADELQRLSYALYSGTTPDPHKVARERNKLLQEIRKQSGHEYFQLPRPYNILCRASQEGPVVILNSHEDGCDGIIIPHPTSEPVHVALPNVTLALLIAQQRDLAQLLSRCNLRTRGDSVSTRLFGNQEGFKSRKTEECFSDLLTWIWVNIVDPVYRVLASHDIHSGRLWWLPTGSFAGLPLHACPPTDQFIHSYTATLGSLLDAQAKKRASVPYKVGVVGVTHTGPGNMNYLKGVEEEVKRISSVIEDHHLECLEGEQTTPDAVKNQLQNCSWVHLACHGIQDLKEPIKSHLLLYDGVLELETILQMPLSNPEFVFLAACQTAMGDVDLVNESFHLGGGFLAAGFRGAIGTLWSMNDEDGPLVAETVYSHLFRDGRQPQASDAAEALHLAVRKLREKGVPYERWMPFIHMGV